MHRFDRSWWRTAITMFAALALLLPAGLARAVEVPVGEWAQAEWGSVKVTTIAPAKDKYAEGDILQLGYRIEANIPEVSNIAVTSDTVAGAAQCNWRNLPAGLAGKYNCGVTSGQAITYTITAADVAAGKATFSTTWTPTGESGTVYDPLTITTTVETGEATPIEWPDVVEGEPRQLAGPGDHGFTCHRIPALTLAPNGWILASWDGRPGGCGDAPQANSIIQSVSKDGGKTWEKPTTVAAGFPGNATEGKYGYSDPSYVLDEETGTLFNFFVKSYDVSFQQSQPGVDPDQRNVLHAVVVESKDNGVTWSEPRNITADITSDVDNWRSRFAASGEGIQLRHGDHAGRLLQQYTIATVNPATYQAVTVYSDDHGATWKVGEPVGTGMDENKVVELADGTVMLNSRRSDAVGGRKVALSTDGGHSYGEVTIDTALTDPRNNASIIRAFPDAEPGSFESGILLFSNANSSGSRTNGTIRVSLDNGETWTASKVFAPGSMSYSTMTHLAEPGVYGLLYEGAGPSIQYMQFSYDWLGVLPVQVETSPATVYRGENTVPVTLTNPSDKDETVAVNAQVPNGWSVGAIDSVLVPAGKSVTIDVPVTVPNWADPGDVPVAITLTSGDRTAQGQANLTVELRDGEQATVTENTTLVSDLPAQSGEGPEYMFDGDDSTIWHSPWGSSVTLPIDIDLQLADDAGELAYLRQVPRSDGPNGRIKDYEVLVGDSLDALMKVAEGTWPNSPGEQIVPLSGSAKFVRLRVLSTYGDSSGKTFASVAELEVHTLAPEIAPPAKPVPTIATAPAKLVGSATNAWGTVDAADGTVVVIEELVDGAWTKVADTTVTDGSYVVSLDGVATAGSHELRAVVDGVPSEITSTLTRVPVTSKGHVTTKLSGNETNVWGTLGGPAKVSTQVKIGDRWSTSQVRDLDAGFFAIPLTYAADGVGTFEWRLVVEHAHGETEVSVPWTLTRISRTSVSHASYKPVGQATNVWGTLGGPAKVSTQVKIGDRWSTSQVRELPAGGYVIPLTYGHDVKGAYTWRLVVEHAHGETEVSAPWTLTRS